MHNRIIYKKPFKVNQILFCRGKGNIEIGTNCSFGYKLGTFHHCGSINLQTRFPTSKIIIGNEVSTNNNISICAANIISIGNNSLIGHNVIMMDYEAHGIMPETRKKIGKIGEVIIGKNVWIGSNVTILKNTRIGDNSIIAAGSVVNKSFPNNVIIGGVPAKIIKKIKSE